MPENIRYLLDFEVHCPFSGIKFGGQVVMPHKIGFVKCENGTLFAYCPIHATRVFINNQVVVEVVTRVANVIETRTRRERPRKKEKTNAAKP